VVPREVLLVAYTMLVGSRPLKITFMFLAVYFKLSKSKSEFSSDGCAISLDYELD
jgi:hypothetical protein